MCYTVGKKDPSGQVPILIKRAVAGVFINKNYFNKRREDSM